MLIRLEMPKIKSMLISIKIPPKEGGIFYFLMLKRKRGRPKR